MRPPARFWQSQMRLSRTAKRAAASGTVSQMRKRERASRCLPQSESGVGTEMMRDCCIAGAGEQIIIIILEQRSAQNAPSYSSTSLCVLLAVFPALPLRFFDKNYIAKPYACAEEKEKEKEKESMKEKKKAVAALCYSAAERSDYIIKY